MSMLFEVLINVVAGWCIVYLLVKVIHIWRPDFGAEKEGPGFTFKTGYLRYYTHGLNSIFYALGRAYRRFWTIWFGAGVWFGALAMATALGILIVNLFRTLAAPSAKNQILTPVIPGVNVPASQIWYFFFTLLIAGVLHEFGHALAGIAEGRQVRGFGVFIMAIYPGAMVHISDDLHILAPFNQLKIFCAGAWHNFVLAVMAWLLVSGSSAFMAPLYAVSSKGGAIVAEVHPDSALEAHFYPGDRVIQLNEYTIGNKLDWDDAFRDMYDKKFAPRSVCTRRDHFDSKLAANLGCCSEYYDGSLQCFEALESVLEDGRNRFCYAASKVVTKNVQYCSSDAECGASTICVKPVLPAGSMILNIIRSDGESTMLSAHPISLYQTLRMTQYKNRWDWMPNSMHSVPLMWDKFWNYMISISAALAVLNLAPVYWLDGEYALKAYLHILFSGWTESDREWLAQTIFRASTALFIVNIVVSMGALYM